LHALPSSSGRNRTAFRLTVAIAASLGVHAGLLGAYAPAGTAGRAGAMPLVLEAFLAPAEPSPAPAPVRDGTRPSGADDARGGDQARAGMPAPEQWLKRSELDSVAMPTKIVKIEYPEGAAGQGAARVQVRLFIDERGVVRKITLETPRAGRAFEEAAVRAWHDVRFSPAMKDGVAVKSQQVIEVEFQPDVAFR
jgi:TonB family protein